MRRLSMAMLLLGLAAAVCQRSSSAGERLTLNFNPDWKFIKSDEPRAAQVDFDDKTWANVSAPHTYNDVDTFDDWSLVGHRGEQNQWSGRTWYRKTFAAPQAWRGKKVFIEFEGVRQVAEVYLNGELLGIHKTGFTPFGFDLTPHLKIGATNVLSVMCDNRFKVDPDDPAAIEASNKSGQASGKKDSGPGGSLASRLARENAEIPEKVEDLRADQIPWNNPHWHPAHGGIYRNVKLHVTDPLHITLPLFSFLQTEGPYVYASDITDKTAKITVEVPIENQRANRAGETADITAEVRAAEGPPVLTLKGGGNLAPSGQQKFLLTGTLLDPKHWQPDYPYLYEVVVTLRDGAGQVVDSAKVPLGIRTAKWDKDTGFAINGHALKLRGWGQKPTDEWPGLGAAQPDWLHFFTLQMMRDAGANFVRWGHCAGGPASIAAADRLGIITDQPGVDGEADTVRAAWKLRSDAFRDVVIYFRNNPSILIWEGGNQKVTKEHAQELRSYVDQYDPHGGRAYAHRRADKITAEFMHVGIGTEGGREIQDLPVVEGEYDREEAPRRVWDDKTPRTNPESSSQPIFGYPEAKGQTYQLTSEQFAANQVAQWVGKMGAADHSGGANWIFSDSTSGGRVACEVARASGEVDGVRLPKEAYYVCRAMFSNEPTIYILGHWNYPSGTKKNVYVASNCDEVELLVNGQSHGKGKRTDKYLFTFPDVPYEPGDLIAMAQHVDKWIITKRSTIGEPIALKITPISGPGGLRADGSDVALLDVEAVDAQGRRCPTFQQRVDFKLEGPGAWRGGYNSGKTNSVNNTYLDLECGINRVAVRSTRTPGQILVTCSSEGLRPTSVAIPSHQVDIDSGTSPALPALPTVALSKDRGVTVTSSAAAAIRSDAAKSAAGSGKYLKNLSYTGPTRGVHVEADAKSGKQIYLDRDEKFTELPQALRGADWIQAAHADRLYNAVDLVEIPATAGSVVYIAHDDRLDRPAWLLKDFRPTETSLTIGGKLMKVFQHRVERDESLTLGANTENEKSAACNMYLVFVNSAPAER